MTQSKYDAQAEALAVAAERAVFQYFTNRVGENVFNAMTMLRDALLAAKQVEGQGIAALVDRFLSWPVPASVYPDGTPGRPGRIGTNLLSAIEAKEMLEYVLAASPAHPADKAVGQVGGDSAEIVQARLNALQQYELLQGRYISEYELYVDGGNDYTPSEFERHLIEDCIAGLLADDEVIAALGAWFALRSPVPSPDSRAVGLLREIEGCLINGQRHALNYALERVTQFLKESGNG